MDRSMQPVRLAGARKWMADAAQAARAVGVLYEERDRARALARSRPRDEKGWRHALRVQRASLDFLRTKKYARFNGRVFYDMYVPSGPGPIFDRMLASRLWRLEDDKDRRFIPTVDLAVTDACMFRCEHCYAIEQLGKKRALDIAHWRSIVTDFQKIGVGAFVLVGGEPLLALDDVVAICEHARAESDIWMVTTGFGLTASKARRLARAGLTAAAVSLDHYEPEKHNHFRGSPKAFDEASKAIALFAQAGVFPSIVVTATRDMIRDGGCMRFMELADRLGAGYVQMFDPIAAGAYVDRPEVALSEAELAELADFQRRVNTLPEYAHLPPVTVRSHIEDTEAFGCGAGGNGFIHVDPTGNLVPCPMLSMTTGNVVKDGFDVAMDRMRAIFPHATAHGPVCPANQLREQIHEAQQRTGLSPLPYEETKRICEHFAETPRPVL
jgi:MoaA/NifB/PqqE/SkfB family radical SAM enzyme